MFNAVPEAMSNESVKKKGGTLVSLPPSRVSSCRASFARPMKPLYSLASAIAAKPLAEVIDHEWGGN